MSHEYRVHSIGGEGRKLVAVFHSKHLAESFVDILRREQEGRDHPREYELTTITRTMS